MQIIVFYQVCHRLLWVEMRQFTKRKSMVVKATDMMEKKLHRVVWNLPVTKAVENPKDKTNPKSPKSPKNKTSPKDKTSQKEECLDVKERKPKI